MQFKGEREISRPPVELYLKLLNPAFVAGCIPDVEAVARAEGDTIACTLRPGFSFVRGTLDLTVHLEGAEAGRRIKYMIETKGIGTSSAVEVELDLVGSTGGTVVHWTAIVKELGGLLKALPKGLVQASAQKIIALAWTSVANQLG